MADLAVVAIFMASMGFVMGLGHLVTGLRGGNAEGPVNGK
jgi:hypothetical protein